MLCMQLFRIRDAWIHQITQVPLRLKRESKEHGRHDYQPDHFRGYI